MLREPRRTSTRWSRRSALGGVSAAAAALGLGLSSRNTDVAAQDATTAQDPTPETMAHHPIVGTWMVSTPAGLAMAVFFADGTNIQGLPATMPGPQGVTYVSTQVGRWKPIDERSVHFTGVQLHTDASGTLVGTVTIDGHPTVGEDGQAFLDDNPDSGPTIRDAAGNVIDVLRGGPPVTGVRMDVGRPSLPGTTSMVGTPTT
jgi:hypothetical protein